MNALDKAAEILGSTSAVARACGVSVEAARKWRKKGCLPRTEWTGETDYAIRLQVATHGAVTIDDLLRRDGVRVRSSRIGQ